ncbi:MAG: hypothetical protein ACD_73C00206G0002 [uncultured bacterium]|nr:MAG: hypothetical protein ACD_73C00206G0002 [uncultured bacterium]
MKILLERIIKEEFIGQLFTDVIHLSIVSFYKKINPFFGGLTVAVLEKQIKGFIGLFIPMVQERAIAFVIHPDNQKILMGFCRSIFFMLISEPMANIMIGPTEKKQKQFETLLGHARLTGAATDLIQEGAVTLLDQLYAYMQKKKLGDFIKLSPKTMDHLASQLVKISLTQLKRDSVQQFFTNEIELAINNLKTINE